MQSINQRTEVDTHRLYLGDFEAFCNPETFPEVSAELVQKVGQGIPQVEPLASGDVKPVSDWGNTVIDDEAKQRIEAQHEALKASGIEVNTKEQYFATGTRMAAEGYATQAARKAEHDAGLNVYEAAAQLAHAVIQEQRQDVELSAAELGRSIETNGKLKGAGFVLREQAIRGLLTRLGSPALSYVLGLRERIAEDVKANAIEPSVNLGPDKAMLAEVLRRECQRYGDVKIKLRTRAALGDCFAVVSPAYVPADAPQVLEQIVDGLPKDARAGYKYDPATTTWELQASVWTPTPVHEQAVGEPFRGYAALSSRDNGTSSFKGGGGIELLRCLNASVYVAEGSTVRRRHLGDILVDISAMVRNACQAIDVLTQAWGTNREQVIEVPEKLKLTDVIPDLWTSLLTDRRQLQGVLKGRTKEHVKKLSLAYFEERRDPEKLVRADLAQSWTRYIQDQPGDIRSDAERAIGKWLVNAPPFRYEPAQA